MSDPLSFLAKIKTILTEDFHFLVRGWLCQSIISRTGSSNYLLYAYSYRRHITQQGRNLDNQQMRPLLFILLLATALACPPNCNDCDPTATVCFSCAEGFELSVLGTCVDSNTISKCDLYGPTNQCFACQATFTISNGQCLKDYSACLAYDPSDDSKCISCGFGTLLRNNVCMGAINCHSNSSTSCSACAAGFTLKNGVCQDSTGNCKTVGGNGVCTACNTGFNLVGYTCIRSNLTVYGCYIFDSNGTCILCKAGYNLYQGNCLLPSQIQQIQQGLIQLSTILTQRSTVSVVTTTTTTTTTTSAAPVSTDFGSGFGSSFGDTGFDSGFGSGFGGGSFGGFDSGSGFGSLPNCLATDHTGSCISCANGYYPSLGTCSQVSVFCDSYDTMTGACLSCKYGFSMTNAKCLDPNCATQVVTGCGACKPLFSLNSNNYCQINDPNCVQANANVCIKCASGFFTTSVGTCSLLPLGCINANPSTLACLSCDNAFKLNNGACIKQTTTTTTTTTTSSSSSSSVTNCVVLTGSTCSSCVAGYQLINNTCISNMFIRPANCFSADPNNPAICVTCNAGFTLSNGACLQTQAPSTPNCQSYNLLTGQCIACVSGYTLSGVVCVPISTISSNTGGSSTSSSSSSSSGSSSSSNGGAITISGGSSTSGSAGSVVNRDPNCAKYTGSTCSSCSNRYYFSSTGVCVPVNPLCNAYNSNGACLTCYPGYVINGPNCIVAKQQDPYCRSYSQGGMCVGCYTGYYFNQQISACQPLNPLCKTSNQVDGTCTSCFPGYNLNAGICAVSFQDPNCQKYDQAKSVCTQCATKFYLDGTGKCRQVSPLCKTANPNTGACLTCYPGYVLAGATCTVGAASNSDVNCQNLTNGVCQKCYSGFFLNPSFMCIQSNPLCKTSDPNTGGCLSCYSGYSLSNGNCSVGNSPTTSSDPNCKSTDQSGVCVACYSGYFLTQGMSCQKMDPLCKTYTSSFNSCASCYDGYSLQFGQCVISSQATSLNSDPYCIKLQGASCIACASGYYLTPSGVCAQLNPLCRTSNMTNGNCIDCYPGYVLSGNTCIVAADLNIPYCIQYAGNSCVACLNGYYPSNGTCALANVLCATYDQSSGACLSCIPGYVFQSGQCILPSLGVDPNCAQYTNSYCTQCQSGFALVSYWCNPIDPSCTQFNPTTNSCTACSGGKVPQGTGCV